MRATLLLGFVGVMLMLFAFQSIADGKVVDALESGGSGVVMIGGAFFVWQRLVQRKSNRKLRRVGSSAALRTTPGEQPREVVNCAGCHDPIVVGAKCSECGAAVHVACFDRHIAEVHA